MQKLKCRIQINKKHRYSWWTKWFDTNNYTKHPNISYIFKS